MAIYMYQSMSAADVSGQATVLLEINRAGQEGRLKHVHIIDADGTMIFDVMLQQGASEYYLMSSTTTTVQRSAYSRFDIALSGHVRLVANVSNATANDRIYLTAFVER